MHEGVVSATDRNLVRLGRVNREARYRSPGALPANQDVRAPTRILRADIDPSIVLSHAPVHTAAPEQPRAASSLDLDILYRPLMPPVHLLRATRPPLRVHGNQPDFSIHRASHQAPPPGLWQETDAENVQSVARVVLDEALPGAGGVLPATAPPVVRRVADQVGELPHGQESVVRDRRQTGPVLAPGQPVHAPVVALEGPAHQLQPSGQVLSKPARPPGGSAPRLPRLQRPPRQRARPPPPPPGFSAASGGGPCRLQLRPSQPDRGVHAGGPVALQAQNSAASPSPPPPAPAPAPGLHGLGGPSRPPPRPPVTPAPPRLPLRPPSSPRDGRGGAGPPVAPGGGGRPRPAAAGRPRAPVSFAGARGGGRGARGGVV